MLKDLVFAIIIGIGATLLLDIWTQLLKHLFKLPAPRWDFVGRWFAYMPRGRFVHPEGISKSAPVASELAIGWVMHYVVGCIFALAVIVIWGSRWLEEPQLLPALIVGWVTVGAGWYILQPGMGVGVACSKAPKPNLARSLNVVGHTVFAIGMYATACLLASN